MHAWSRRSANSPRLIKLLTTHFIQTFITPFRDRAKANLLLFGLLGILCAGLQSMVINFSIANEGPAITFAYHAARLLLLGTIGIPFSLWLQSLPKGKFLVAGLQIIGTLCFMFGTNFPILNAFGFVFTCSPFWGLFSKSYAIKQSHEKRGQDTAIFIYIQTIASAAGFLLGGVFLQAQLYMSAMIVAGIGLVISTFYISTLIPSEPILIRMREFFAHLFSKDTLYAKAWSYINKRKPTTQLTFLSASVILMVDIGLPTWMSLMNLEPLSAGISLSLRPILGLVLTPVVGNLVQKSSLRVGQLGGLFMLVGWGFLTFTIIYPIMLFPAIAVWAIAINLIAPTEAGWWLKKRSGAAIVAREIVLAAGRVPAIAIMMPLLFLSPPTFPFVGLSGSILFLLKIQQINRRISFRNALGWRASNRNQ